MSALSSKKSAVKLLSFFLLVALATTAGAATLFERDLPSQNINWAAGSNRSNAAPIQGTIDPGGGPVPFLLGDDFTLGTSAWGAWDLHSLTVWVVGNTVGGGTLSSQFNAITLYGGPGGVDPIASLSGAALDAAATRVFYSGGLDYESLGSAGTFYPLYQLTFSGLNWLVPDNQLTYFAVGGDPIGINTFNLHGSNAPLSGGIQDGADQAAVLFLQNAGQWTATYSLPAGYIQNYDLGVDINVIIAGEAAVPEPSTFAFLGLGLCALSLKLRRK